MTSADFNNDGYLDFTVTHGGGFTIYYNNGTGGFTAQIFPTSGKMLDSLCSGDFNHDGYVDLLYSYSLTDPGQYKYLYGIVGLLLNQGPSGFSNETIIYRTAAGDRIHPHLVSADFNRDGNPDFIVGDNSGKVELYLGDGHGSFTSAGIIHDWGQVSWGLATGDMNHDGAADFLVWCDQHGHSPVYLKYNNQKQGRYFSHTQGTPFFDFGIIGSLAALDYNGDGNIDLFVVQGGLVMLYINQDGIFYPFQVLILPNNDGLYMGGLAVGDFNNDGRMDVVTGGNNGVVRVFYNNQEQPTGVAITSPLEHHLTINGEARAVPILWRTVVIGNTTTIKVKTFGDVVRVDFFVNGALKSIDTEPPFEWEWSGHGTSTYDLQVIGYDSQGNRMSDYLTVTRIAL